jgi:tetratricopeptide (TPR) repeat protein
MRIGRLWRFLFVVIFSVMGCVYASSVEEHAAGLFSRGNSEYQRGNYASAERYYHEILDSGVASGPVYYNLGNACFKQKRLGDAIYYWEKAQQKLPADREIRENLELANLLLIDRIETASDPLPLQFLSRMQNLLTIEQESRLVLTLFVAVNLLIALYLFTHNSRYASRVLIASFCIGSLFIIFAFSLSWKIYEKDFRKQGIVIQQKVDVRSGPGSENITVFTIHEGIKVRIHGSSDGWYQISLPNGWNGWLPRDDIRIL